MRKQGVGVRSVLLFAMGLSGAVALPALATSCSNDGSSISTSTFDAGDTSSSSSSGASSSGFVGSDGGEDGGDPPPLACVSKEADAIPGTRPVDIIFAIDNSESMSQEIGEVEAQINVNFAAVIEASKVDYRVVMLSEHGLHGGDPATNPIQRVCIKAPLSGTQCSPVPPKPVETEKFIHHNITVNSQDAFCKILESFNGPDKDGARPQGWKTFLRPGAFKVFGIITDDRVLTSCRGFDFNDKFDDPVSGMTAAQTFDSALISLSALHFGRPSARNYVWHSIVGLSSFDPSNPSKPHPPEAPIVTTQCSPGSVAPATGYQGLSKLTGGLRFPTCGLNYTTMFQEMARSVIQRAVVSCDYAMPQNPPGGTIDPSTAVVRYTSGAQVLDFKPVANEAACAPGSFFIAGNRIKLCGDACSTVQADPAAKVKILFSCFPKEVQ